MVAIKLRKETRFFVGKIQAKILGVGLGRLNDHQQFLGLDGLSPTSTAQYTREKLANTQSLMISTALLIKGVFWARTHDELGCWCDFPESRQGFHFLSWKFE